MTAYWLEVPTVLTAKAHSLPLLGGTLSPLATEPIMLNAYPTTLSKTFSPEWGSWRIGPQEH